MTSKEFTIWLKGFITACNEYSPTPKQWDIIKEELDKVSDEPKIGTPIGQGGWGTPNITPIMPLPYYSNPLDNPYKITCDYPGVIDTNPFKYGMNWITGSGTTFTPGFAVTTTPGYGFTTLSGSGQLWQSSTSTAYNPESGSWHYTNGGNDIKD